MQGNQSHHHQGESATQTANIVGAIASGDEVVNPTTKVQTATTEATIAGDGESISPTTTEVISPAEPRKSF